MPGCRGLRGALTVMFFVGTFGLNFQLTSALMATEVYGKGAGEYGILGSTMALGSVAGALIAARRETVRLRLVLLAAVTFGLVEIVIAFMPSYVTFALMTPLVGLTSLTTITAANQVVQLGVPDEVRGRVMALYLMVFMGGTPIGSPFIGWVGEAYGARWTLLVGGVLTVLSTVVCTALFARRQIPASRLPRFRYRLRYRRPDRTSDRPGGLGQPGTDESSLARLPG